MIAYSVLSIQFVPVNSQGSSNHVFFHGQSPRPDISIFGMTGAEFYYDGVDSNPPAGYGVTRDVTASISASSLASLGTSQCPVQVSSEMQAASFGFVLWTLPAPANTQVDGEIQIDVWMSSSDSPGFGAGYFFAIADVNPQNPHDICVLNYKINGGLGFNLGNSATLYSTSIFGGSFRISNHVFATGRTVAFLAGAGAQKSGWRFTVYFDGSSTPSGAYVPSTLLSQTTTSATTGIPEFPTTLNPSMIAALTILCFLLMEPAKNAKGGLEKALDYSK
jgi:hypothetical protein